MATLNVEVREHPAQKRFNGEPLFFDDGTPVPAAPHHRSIWLNGQMIGYCGDTADKPMSFIKPPSVITPQMREVIVEKVATQLGGDWHDANKVSQVPDIPKEMLREPSDD